MMIEKVHGLQATSMSLNDRFTMLAAAAVARPRIPRRRTVSAFDNMKNRQIVEQFARRLDWQAKRQALRQRLGIPGLRRFGSESNLSGLRRSNSFGNLNQNFKNRIGWRQSNGNLSRAASFSNLGQSLWRGRGRGFRRRGGRIGPLRGRLRGRGRGVGTRSGVGRGRGRGRGANRARRRITRGNVGRGAPQRGGMTRYNQKPIPTKEELDTQLDQYMASTKSALDKELDAYMKNAMELE